MNVQPSEWALNSESAILPSSLCRLKTIIVRFSLRYLLQCSQHVHFIREWNCVQTKWGKRFFSLCLSHFFLHFELILIQERQFFCFVWIQYKMDWDSCCAFENTLFLFIDNLWLIQCDGRFLVKFPSHYAIHIKFI